MLCWGDPSKRHHLCYGAGTAENRGHTLKAKKGTGRSGPPRLKTDPSPPGPKRGVHQKRPQLGEEGGQNRRGKKSTRRAGAGCDAELSSREGSEMATNLSPGVTCGKLSYIKHDIQPPDRKETLEKGVKEKQQERRSCHLNETNNGKENAVIRRKGKACGRQKTCKEVREKNESACRVRKRTPPEKRPPRTEGKN